MGLRLCGYRLHATDEASARRWREDPRYGGDTDTVAAAVFTCTHCNAVPEQVVEGKAAVAIVRHKLGCPTLMAQTRTRWPAQVRWNASDLSGI
jgi:hypothetical protein